MIFAASAISQFDTVTTFTTAWLYNNAAKPAAIGVNAADDFGNRFGRELRIARIFAFRTECKPENLCPLSNHRQLKSATPLRGSCPDKWCSPERSIDQVESPWQFAGRCSRYMSDLDREFHSSGVGTQINKASASVRRRMSDVGSKLPLDTYFEIHSAEMCLI